MAGQKDILRGQKSQVKVLTQLVDTGHLILGKNSWFLLYASHRHGPCEYKGETDTTYLLEKSISQGKFQLRTLYA